MRFPGFKGEWEHKKLARIVEFKVTNSFSRENLNYETGKVKNIHYGDIHTKFHTLFDITRENVPYVNEQISLGRISDDFYCKEGDIIFADASEDLKDVGKNIEIVNLNGEKLLSGLHTLLARPKTNNFQKRFSGYLFRSTNVRLQIQKEAQGSKVLSINVGRLSNIILSIPSIPEQKKVADFLSLIDERITAQSKIIENLETLIKGLREKLFIQKLRFKDEEGNNFPDWEVKRLGEIASKKSSTISANKIEDNFGKFILYGASGILKHVDFYEEEKDYVSIIKDGAGVGRLLYCCGKSSVLGTMEIIKPKEPLHTYFLYCVLCDIDFAKYITGSTIPHIYFKDYSNELCGIPCLKEQTKIANFLSGIDEKIETEKKVAVQFEAIKIYLLQNLFI